MGTIKTFIKKHIIGTDLEYISHFETLLFMFKHYLKDFKPHNLLDVGCNDGKRTLEAMKLFSLQTKETYGVEYEEHCVEKCEGIFNAARIDLDKERLPYHDDMFSLVICNQVIEHLKNTGDVINDIIRVTQPGGYIIIGVPNLAHLINRFFLLLGIQPMCIGINSSHVRGFTHQGFLKYLNKLNSVTVIASAGAVMYPFPVIIGNLLGKYFPGLSGYTCYLLKKV